MFCAPARLGRLRNVYLARPSPNVGGIFKNGLRTLCGPLNYLFEELVSLAYPIVTPVFYSSVTWPSSGPGTNVRFLRSITGMPPVEVIMRANQGEMCDADIARTNAM